MPRQVLGELEKQENSQEKEKEKEKVNIIQSLFSFTCHHTVSRNARSSFIYEEGSYCHQYLKPNPSLKDYMFICRFLIEIVPRKLKSIILKFY